MADADELLQGFLIGTFVLIGFSSISYCIRHRLQNKTTLKQSPSMEDLNSVSTEDPLSNV